MLVILIFNLITLSQQSTTESTDEPNGLLNSTSKPRVFNGEIVDTNSREFGYFVTIHESASEKEVICGGSIYDTSMILTAAHCVINRKPANTFIRLNYDNRLGTLPPEEYFQALKFDCHPKFEENPLKNDICLVKLNKTIPLDDRIAPIELPSKQYPPSTSLIAVGVGVTEVGVTSRELRKINMVLQHPEKCTNGALPEGVYTYDVELCVQGTHHNVPCVGDSGGPLAVHENDHHFLVGINSYIDKKCSTAEYSAPTNVFHFVEWIHSKSIVSTTTTEAE